MKTEKKRIFLAGDSTVQSYTKETEPQTGWGQMWCEYFQGAGECRAKASADSSFSQSTSYELPQVIIDNRAMAGRSSRSFREEGRLADIAGVISEGDYLFVQFGHNDAYREKEERYVSPDQFGASLDTYVQLCREKGALCVLVTPIAMRNCEDNPEGKFTFSFPEYREAMLQYAKEADVPVLDLGKATTEYLTMVGSEGCKELFLWVKPGEYPESTHKAGAQDNAHLKTEGARAFAGILTRLVKEYDRDDRLDEIKSFLK